MDDGFDSTDEKRLKIRTNFAFLISIEIYNTKQTKLTWAISYLLVKILIFRRK